MAPNTYGWANILLPNICSSYLPVNDSLVLGSLSLAENATYTSIYLSVSEPFMYIGFSYIQTLSPGSYFCIQLFFCLLQFNWAFYTYLFFLSSRFLLHYLLTKTRSTSKANAKATHQEGTISPHPELPMCIVSLLPCFWSYWVLAQLLIIYHIPYQTEGSLKTGLRVFSSLYTLWNLAQSQVQRQ